MSLFISWSGKRSKKIASFLDTWLDHRVHGMGNPWISFKQECLPQGVGDNKKIAEASQKCKACLLIITKECLEVPWILFEAGMFYGQGKEVFMLLCGNITHEQVKAKNLPLSDIYATYPSMGSITHLVQSIDTICNPNPRDKVKIKDDVKSTFNQFKKYYDLVFPDTEDNPMKLSAEAKDDLYLLDSLTDITSSE
jgi:hypothetical protein